MKILILCSDNSCRSQMAHGFLKSFASNATVCSAGTNTSGEINPMAVEAMKEIGIDISSHTSESVGKYLNDAWDFVITVCNEAKENCPTFTGKVNNSIHMGFDDPSEVTGSEDAKWSEVLRVRDEIEDAFYIFFLNNILT